MHQHKPLSNLKREPQMNQENHSNHKLLKPHQLLLLNKVSKLLRPPMLPKEIMPIIKTLSMRREESELEELQ